MSTSLPSSSSSSTAHVSVVASVPAGSDDVMAYRCNRCWQMTAAQSSQAGTEVECLSCSTPVVVPDATPERLKAGEEYLATLSAAEPAAVDLSPATYDATTDQEIYKKAEEHAKANAPLSYQSASRMKRFLGAMIDSTAWMFVSGLGFAAGMMVAAPVDGEFDSPGMFLLAMSVVPLMFALCQFQMTAVDGRTVGKYCMGTKVVNLKGDAPGWLQGVIIRTFVVFILCFIPFFGLANSIWIFLNDEKRCLHDLLAGTYVINA